MSHHIAVVDRGYSGRAFTSAAIHATPAGSVAKTGWPAACDAALATACYALLLHCAAQSRTKQWEDR
jgi:hypothetical protein